MAEDSVSALAQAAMRYAALGWRVIPLRPKDKKPWFPDWPKLATTDEATIAEWWARHPTANVGIVLGPESRLVDFETDNEEEERALLRLFDGVLPPGPIYVSSRGRHHLFLWRPDLPTGLKGILHYGALAIRTGADGKGIQSAAPPSIHPSGAVYTWLTGCSPDEIDLPEIPDAVIAKLWNLGHEAEPEKVQRAARPKSRRMAIYEQPTVPEGQRNDTLYREACALWNEQQTVRGAGALEDEEVRAVVYRRVWAINQACCKPPLDEAEIATALESARQWIRQRAAAEEQERNTPGPPAEDGPGKEAKPALVAGTDNLVRLGLDFTDGEYWPGKWRLETVNSTPRVYRLLVPFVKQAIELSTEQFRSAAKVATAVQEAAGDVVLDEKAQKWGKLWRGYYDKKAKVDRLGLMAKLLDGSILVKKEAPSETKRHLVVAEFVWSYISHATAVEEGKEPWGSGRPWRAADGSIWFAFQALYADSAMQRHADKITRNELSRCIAEIGGETKYRKGTSYKRVPTSGADVLERAIGASN